MIEVYLTLPSGETIEVDDELSIFARETFRIFFNKKCSVSSDENVVIKNYGYHCDVEILEKGNHRLSIKSSACSVSDFFDWLFGYRHIDVHCKLRTAVKLNMSFTNSVLQ